MIGEHTKGGNTSMDHDFLREVMIYTEYKIGKNLTQKWHSMRSFFKLPPMCLAYYCFL